MEFDTWSLVILRRPDDAQDLPDAELEALQQRHLDHLRSMHEQGHLAIAGPFSDQPDERLRGMCLYRVPLDQARSLAEADPSVRAGRLAVDVLTWWTQKGELAFGDGA